MNKGVMFIFFILLSSSVLSDSFRCKKGVVKSGDSENKVLKTCGDPARKFKTHETTSVDGYYDAGVSHYVYERSGKKDMIVSIRNGLVIKIEPDK